MEETPVSPQIDVALSKRKKAITKVIKITKSAFSKGFLNPFEIEGVTKLALSSTIQKILGVIVGDDVTAENPWKYVKKEAIEENIELYADSSDFFPIKEEISNYPKREILLGYIDDQSPDADVFYVVHSIDAEDIISKILERRQEELQERLKKLVRRPAGVWKSLGSEAEISGTQIQNLRTLYEIEIQSKFPLTDTKVTFKMRKVEDAEDGYVELLPDTREPIINVVRRRVDASVQAGLDKISNEAQTTPTYPINIWTQYEFAYEEKELDETSNKNMTEFLQRQIEHLDATIKVNEHINMYEDDYANLNISDSRLRLDASAKMSIFHSYSDVQTCKGLLVSDCSWNCFTTGVVAVCYTDAPFSTLYQEKSTTDEVIEAVHGCCPILIWSYTDGVQPKLYLETPRQVTYVSFCPFKKNIIVGGCINGQVLIWDIGNKLEEVEKVEILTPKQTRNRIAILSMMEWMKGIRNIAIVQPSIISSLEVCHKDMVTAILWVSTNMEITPTGQYNCVDHKTQQFLTCSTDGTVLVWDMNIKPSTEVDILPEMKTKRFKEMPPALRMDVSVYETYSESFKPHYKILINEKDKPFPIMSVIRKTSYMKYEPVGTVNPNPAARTEYQLAPDQSRMEKSPFLLTSTTGKLAEISWEGFDYNDDENILSEAAKISYYQSIHDGPIIVCNTHPTMENYVLTIGGSIFAVWRLEDAQALLWRKASKGCRYLSGGWTIEHPSYVILIRSDGSFELWDFLVSSLKPTRVVSLGGDMLINILGTLTSPHCRKSTFAVSDSLGTLNILHIPEILKVHRADEVSQCYALFSRGTERKTSLNLWMWKFLENHNKEVAKKSKLQTVWKIPGKKVEEKEDIKPVAKMSELEKMDRIFTGVQWNFLQEKVMFKTIIQKKKLDLAELEQQKIPLQKIATDQKERQLKQETILSNKPKIIKNAEAQIILEPITVRQRRYSLPKGADEADDYLKDFEEIEERALNYIKCNEFKMQFDWSNVLEDAKKTRKSVETILQYNNKHTRHINKKLARSSAHI